MPTSKIPTHLVETLALSGGHVFVFSARPGTPAAGYTDQVPFQYPPAAQPGAPGAVCPQAECFQASFTGQALDVLWQRSIHKPGGWLTSGLSDNYIKVTAHDPG